MKKKKRQSKKMVKPFGYLILLIGAIIVIALVGHALSVAKQKQFWREQGIDTEGWSAAELRNLQAQEVDKIEITTAEFSCQDDYDINSRAYVLVQGYLPDKFPLQHELIRQDTKTVGILEFTYQPDEALESLSDAFSSQVQSFVDDTQADEVIVLGLSLGGVLVSETAHLLENAQFEVHTFASPLKGCGATILTKEDQGLSGITKQVGIGLSAFKEPKDNTQVFHHKTVTDETLSSGIPGVLEYSCDALSMQNNNVPNSQEFYYADKSHIQVVEEISSRVIRCQK